MDNITQVHFKDGQESIYGITGLKQWDKGQKLEISGLHIDEDAEVHFSLSQYDGVAKRMLGEMIDGILHTDIPAFIMEGHDYVCAGARTYSAYAWVYVSDEESAETIRKMELVIETRAKPEEYVTPEDIGLLEQMEGDLKSKLDKSGHTPNKILATDAEGNVITKDDIKVDSQLSAISTNPVENKAVAKEIAMLSDHVDAENEKIRSEMDEKDSALRLELDKKVNKDHAKITRSLSMGRVEGTTVGANSVAIGHYVTASGRYSHAEGISTKALGESSHAEGAFTEAIGGGSHCEGASTVATGKDSHTEGLRTVASGDYSHIEGESSNCNEDVFNGANTMINAWGTDKFARAAGQASHVEGRNCLAIASCTHAEGHVNIARGSASHAEGEETQSIGVYSHSEGKRTKAIGQSSHAEGKDTVARGDYQHVQGKFNVEDTENKYAHIVGNGTSTSDRSNAYTLDWQGNARFAGDVVAGNTSLQRMEEMFLKSLIKPTTPKDTFLNVRDSADYKALDFGMEGKTEQKQYSGKNLFDGEFALGSLGTNDGLQQESTTSLITDFIELENGTYSISGLTGYEWFSIAYNEDKTFSRYIGMNASKVTMEGTEKYIRIMLYNNTVKPTEVMLNAGTTALPYEPYTGRQPSPNPDYPQEIVNAGEIYNLLKLTERTIVDSGAYGKDTKRFFNGNQLFLGISSDNYFDASTINGYDITENTVSFSTTNAGYVVGFDVPVIEGKTYRLSCVNDDRVDIAFYDEEGGWLSYLNDVKNKTIICPANAFWGVILFKMPDVVYLNPMFNKGSMALPYEPHTNRYGIRCEVENKNLLDISKNTTTDRCIIQEDGSIKSNISDYYFSSIYITDEILNDALLKQKGKMITLSVKETPSNRRISIYIKGDRTDNYSYQEEGAGNGQNRFSFILSDTFTNIEFVSIRLNRSSEKFTDTETVFEELMLNIGEYTYYLPHQSQSVTLTSPVPLTKWDKLVKRDGVYGWSINSVADYKVTGRETFTIPTNGTVYYTGSSTDTYFVQSNILRVKGIYERTVYCNELSFVVGIWSVTDGSIGITNNEKQIHMRFSNSTIGVSDEATREEKMEAYITYLRERYDSGNPITIQYQTDEEQAFYPLPDSEQTLLNNLETYYGVTNICNDQGCPMWLTYVADTKLYIDNKINSAIADVQALALEM